MRNFTRRGLITEEEALLGILRRWAVDEEAINKGRKPAPAFTVKYAEQRLRDIGKARSEG